MAQKRTTNKYLQKLDKFFKDNKFKPYEEEEIYNFLGLSRTTFRSAAKNFPSKRSAKIQKPFTLSFVHQMFLACGINPDIFVLEKEDQEVWDAEQIGRTKNPSVVHYTGKEPLTTRWSPQNTLKEILDLDYKTGKKKNKKKFTNKYVKTVSPYITKGTNSILVCENLTKGLASKPGIYLDAYQKAHDKIFEKIIEPHISTQIENNPDFKYVRVLTLPRDEFPVEPVDQIVEALDQCSLETFKHIYRCLKKYDRNHISICVAPVKRPIHYGIINGESHLIVTETYKYITSKQKTFFVPDILFIEEFSKPGAKIGTLYRIYRDEIKDMARHNKIRSSDFIRSQDPSSKSILDKLEARLEDYKIQRKDKLQGYLERKISFIKPKK